MSAPDDVAAARCDPPSPRGRCPERLLPFLAREDRPLRAGAQLTAEGARERDCSRALRPRRAERSGAAPRLHAVEDVLGAGCGSAGADRRAVAVRRRRRRRLVGFEVAPTVSSPEHEARLTFLSRYSNARTRDALLERLGEGRD
ncbi:MAG: hypothetical protein R3F59_08435 [Myxococcota bacterium]